VGSREHIPDEPQHRARAIFSKVVTPPARWFHPSQLRNS